MDISIAHKSAQATCLVLLSLLFGCATAPTSPSLDASRESSHRAPTDDGQDEKPESEEDDIPLSSCIPIWRREAKILSEMIEKEAKIRFSETIECDDGTILPLGCSKPSEFSKRKWSDQQATKIQKQRACSLAKSHENQLRETEMEVTALGAIHASLIAMRDSSKKVEKEIDWKPAKNQIAALITGIATLGSAKLTITDIPEDTAARHHRVIENRMAFVLEFTKFTLKALRNKKIRTGLRNALNANIQLIDDAMTDILVDYRHQKRQAQLDKEFKENLDKK